MRALLTVWIVVMLVHCTIAQTPSLLLLSQDTSYAQGHAAIMLQGSGAFASTAADNLFMRKMVFGGFIDGGHINHLVSRMREVNRAGADLMGGITLYSFSDSIMRNARYGLMARAGHFMLSDISFSRSLFRTVFQGNAQFAGQTIHFDPLNLHYQAYQKFGVGLFDRNNFSSFTLSFVNGQDYHSLRLDNSQFFISASGDSLHLSYQGQYQRSDTAQHGFGAGDGQGLALDMQLNIPLGQNRREWMSLTIDNLVGLVWWNQNFETFDFDSSASFTGVEVNNLFDFSVDSLQFTNLQDSVKYTYTRGRKGNALPADIRLRWLGAVGEHAFAEAGIRVMPGRTGVPQLQAAFHYAPVTDFTIGLRVQYGGFGYFQLGAEVQWLAASRWYLRAATSSLTGLASGDQRSRDLSFSLCRFFGRS